MKQVAYVERLFKLVTHMALDRNCILPRNFIYFCIFLKRKTPDIKHHAGEDHSNSFQPYYNPQQSRFAAFCYPQVSRLRFEQLVTKIKT
jgi:hypothetical protein